MRNRDALRRYWHNLGRFAAVATVIGTLLGTAAFGVWLARARAMGLVHPGRSSPACRPADRGVEHGEREQQPAAV